MSENIDKVYNDIARFIKDNNMEKHFATTLRNLVREIHLKSLSETNKGYCMKFQIPEKPGAVILNDVTVVTSDQLEHAMMKDWELEHKDAPMYRSQYYHNMLILMLYGVRNDNEDIYKNAFLLILFRLWNGRVTHSFPRNCNPDIMNYVTNVMMNKKFYANKFPTPLELITNHFAPKLLTKYKDTLIKDSFNTKIVFERSFGRLRQIFRHDPVPNLIDGTTNYSSGLQPLYYKAAQKNLRMSTKSGGTNPDDESELSDNFTSSDLDSIVEEIKNFIIMENRMTYDDRFLDFLMKEEKILLKKETILNIYKAIHDINYGDYISEITNLIFLNIKTINKNDICDRNFFTNIFKPRIISSKHTQTNDDLKKLVTKFIEKLFDDMDIKKDYQKTYYTQIKKTILYFFAYNIRHYICHN